MTLSSPVKFLSPWLRRDRLLLMLCLFACALRLFQLGAQSLWYDEGFSAWLSARPLDEITARTAADIHPPLYYYLLHYWMLWCGQSEFSLRFMSLIPGVMLVPAIFFLARRLVDEVTGWIAALLTAASPVYVWYSQEARMYMPLVLLTVLSSYFFWRWTEKPARKLWVAMTLCNVLAVYLHFYAFFIVAFQLLYFILWWMRQETRWGILLAGLASAGVAGAAYMPWARFVFDRLQADESYFEGTLPLAEVLRKTFIMFSTGHTMLEVEALLPASIFLVLAALGWLIVGRLRTDSLASWDDNPFRRSMKAGAAARLFLLLYLTVPFTLLYVVSYARPKFHPRYLLIASPPFLILIAAALTFMIVLFRRGQQARFRDRMVALSMVGAVGVLVASVSINALWNLYADPRFNKDDFRGVVAAIRANRGADEPTILVAGHMFPVYSYYDPGGHWIALPNAPTLSTTRVLGYNVANDLNAALSGRSGAWLLLWQNEVVDPGGFVPTILDGQAARLAQAQSFWGVQLLHYRIPPGTVFFDKPQIQRPTAANFGGQVQLLGYNGPSSPPAADKGLQLTLYWRALADLTKDYQVALRVRDADGHLLGSLDARPATYNYPTTRWTNGDILFGNFVVPLKPGTPPGNYRLEVTMYSADEPEGLDVLDASANPAGKVFSLTGFQIARAATPPNVEQLKPNHTLHFTFSNMLEMLGFDQDRERAEPGDAINLIVYWRALNVLTDDLQVRFEVSRGASAPDDFTGDAAVPLALAYPTSAWKQGEIVRAQYTAYVPVDMPAGERAFRLVVVDRNNRRLSAPVGLVELRVDPSTRIFRAPVPRVVDIVRFGTGIQLYGYDLAPTPVMTGTVAGLTTVTSGQPLRLTLYWRPTQRTLGTSYTVFVHLLREGAPILSQRDAVPVNGARPTTTWIPGEYIADSYDIAVPRDAPLGRYILEVGLFDPITGIRLAIGANGQQPTAARLGVQVAIQ